MAIKMIPVKCPQCGADLEAEEGRKTLFCQYCGAKVIIQNDNEHIYHTIDDAAIKQAETDRIVKLKRIELAEKERESAARTKLLKIKIALALGAIGGILLILGFLLGEASGDSDSGLYMIAMVGFYCILGAAFVGMSAAKKKDDDDDDFGDKIKVPNTISDYERKNYTAIEAIFRSAGFVNIKCVPLNDLTTGLLKKPGLVESITINGKEITSGGRKFSSDASVVISYHSFSGR